MNYDCLIIGGGVAGLTCGLKCLESGLKAAVFSAGMSALHFSSGSVDLLGYFPDEEVVYEPFDRLPEFIRARPDHPYARCGPDLIEECLRFFREQVRGRGLEMHADGRRNHLHVTTLGTLKPTYFSQASVFNERVREAYLNPVKLAILTFEGFRDFHPELAAANLVRRTMLRGREIVTGAVPLPEEARQDLNPHELRSVDISRMFDSARGLEEAAREIVRLADGAKIVGLPAFIGLENYNQALARLEELTGLTIYEIPTLPPSILGLRLDNALKSEFTAKGGVYIAGDRVIGGEIAGGRLDHVHTQQFGRARLKAEAFVLATGSFFSGGLASEFDIMREPVFGLKLKYPAGRGSWSGRAFFDPAGHPFLKAGVENRPPVQPVRPGRPGGGKPVLRRRGFSGLRPHRRRQRRRGGRGHRVSGGPADH